VYSGVLSQDFLIVTRWVLQFQPSQLCTRLQKIGRIREEMPCVLLNQAVFPSHWSLLSARKSEENGGV
jgi:hypothetical protein